MQQSEREQRIEHLRGSRRWTESEARYVLESWGASGEPLSRFARRMKLCAERLRWWKNRLRWDAQVPSNPVTGLAKFVPVVVKAEPAYTAVSAVLVIEGARVELRELNPTSAMWAATLLQTLSERP